MTNLADENEIPLPDGTGSSGSRSAQQGIFSLMNPQSGLPVVEAIEKGLAASPRAFGEFGSIMLAGAARQLANENQELKVEIAQIRQSWIDSAMSREAKESSMLMLDQVKSEQGNRHTRNFGITIGTTLASAGLLRSRTIIDEFSLALIVGGALLLLVSWFSPIKRGKIHLPRGTKHDRQ